MSGGISKIGVVLLADNEGMHLFSVKPECLIYNIVIIFVK
jgi:hypothetical protein